MKTNTQKDTQQSVPFQFNQAEKFIGQRGTHSDMIESIFEMDLRNLKQCKFFKDIGQFQDFSHIAIQWLTLADDLKKSDDTVYSISEDEYWTMVDFCRRVLRTDCFGKKDKLYIIDLCMMLDDAHKKSGCPFFDKFH